MNSQVAENIDTLTSKKSSLDYTKMANAIRALSMDAVEKANSGHPGMPMGMADVATVLFSKYLKFDAKNPTWADRDRFILSAGHGSMLLYSLLYLTGYEKMTIDEIKNFRQLHSLTPGHPEVMPDCGIETTTGPLGQGISTAVGFALAERIMNARFSDDLVDHYTYTICSDGDLMEGISHEACALAGHLKLDRLIVLYDDNGITIDGPTSLSYSDDNVKRFQAYGWDVQVVDGHSHEEIDLAISHAKTTATPSIICCKTHIGYGAPEKQDSSSSHGSPLGASEIAGARKNLNWPYEPFEIPHDILVAWRKIGERNDTEYKAWEKRLNDNRYKDQFATVLEGKVDDLIKFAIEETKQYFITEQPRIATRKTSGKALEKIVKALPFMIGGSADLTGSVNTKVAGPEVITADNYDGQYINYGVREHGMAAIQNGMALHGGIIPYSGTFLSFSDYCRPAIRLSALMKQRVIYVMTHDSIGLGEDGPTHQPVEHVAALRTIPNLYVFRPCDGVETAEAWQLALNKTDAPSMIVLTRQDLMTARQSTDAENLSAKGGYIIRQSSIDAQAVIMATGSEVELAIKAAQELEKSDIAARVVSMPCMDLFEEQDEEYQKSVLGDDGIVRVAVEAGVRQGWDRWIGSKGDFIGMSSFGESAPYEELYEHFNITVETIVKSVKSRIN